MVTLLEGRLHGEGQVLRRLASLGYRLAHEQSALHEFDFSVGCLAADLRDGIRLCKVVEVLAGATFRLDSKKECPKVRFQ